MSQADLGAMLGLSQARLSQVERGQGSFSAEQLLRILSIFNIGAEHFARSPESGVSALQNALVRVGASHLVASDVPVPSTLEDPANLVFFVLLDPESPRHVAALAPVLVKSIDRISLPMLAAKLKETGRDARLGWLLESVRNVLVQQAPAAYSNARREMQRALATIDLFLKSRALHPGAPGAAIQLLDANIRSLDTAERVLAEASDEAKKWKLATRLTRDDFAEALKAAYERR